MENFDFLNSIGESKNNFKDINVNKDLKKIIEYLEILRNRNLMNEDFKNEVLDLLVNEKISNEIFYREIQKSIDAFKEIELKILSVDESVFKLKNDELEYIGAIDRMPNDSYILSPNRGKVSYSFAKELFKQLKGRRIKLGELISMSDSLDFKVIKIFNVEQLTK
jgi:hypothetical protein